MKRIEICKKCEMWKMTNKAAPERYFLTSQGIVRVEYTGEINGPGFYCLNHCPYVLERTMAEDAVEIEKEDKEVMRYEAMQNFIIEEGYDVA